MSLIVNIMDIDNPPLSSSGDPSSTTAEDRRKSGRQTRRPEVFSQSTFSAEDQASGKRKRGEVHEDDEEVSESDSDNAGDDETDEEELREKRRAARRNGTQKPSKSKPKTKGSHASKKPKVTSASGRQLAFRPAANGRLPTGRSRKPKARPSLAAGERGLFGKLSFPRSVDDYPRD